MKIGDIGKVLTYTVILVVFIAIGVYSSFLNVFAILLAPFIGYFGRQVLNLKGLWIGTFGLFIGHSASWFPALLHSATLPLMTLIHTFGMPLAFLAGGLWYEIQKRRGKQTKEQQPAR